MKDYDEQVERHQHLRDLYMKQLRDVAHFKYVLPFAMYGDNGHVLYYLIYGTNSEDGVDLMKYCMWIADPVSGSGFRDRVARDTNMLWPPDEDGPDLVPLEDLLLERYAGCSGVSFADIRRDVLLGPTQYRDTQAADVLKDLDRKEEIQITREGKSQSTWTVTFPPRSGDSH